MQKKPTPNWPTLTCNQCRKSYQCPQYAVPTSRYCSKPCYTKDQKTDPIARFWALVDKRGLGDCWDWIGARHTFGYGLFAATHSTLVGAHRFSWELANGPIPDGGWILHLCDRPSCCNPAHLELGTPAINSKQMTERTRSARGERNAAHKLTDENVREIRRLLARGMLQKVIAPRFKVDVGVISQIKRGLIWKHVA
jgi:hypothetical protein